MPEKIDLNYAFNLAPEEAINYFKAKGYAFSWNWYEVWQEAHQAAFTVAKAMRQDILDDIRIATQQALEEGRTLQQFRAGLEPTLKAKGWWGKVMVGDAGGGQVVQLGSPWRLRTIYQTNLQTSYMAGRYQEQAANIDDRPYWQYVAVMDAATRPSHAAMNGLVFPADDPFWDSFYPPNDWGCRCSVRALSPDNVKERDLMVRASKGLVHEKEVEVGGKKKQVAVFTDWRTGQQIKTGPGWNYNPGK
ncbi:MAG: hypothetical protein A3J97_10725 [Spirochaetes bacterium RIFOXYC1_FULL_54_7]|nr:MAG: hypothetical protein A3J97_10725 [Spirochaetes bacterium RIFOXYC1_FULL_54_7]